MFRDILKTCNSVRPLEQIIFAYESRRAEIRNFFFDKDGAVRVELCSERNFCPVCNHTILLDAGTYQNWPMLSCDNCESIFSAYMPNANVLSHFLHISEGERSFISNILAEGFKTRSTAVTSRRVDWVNRLVPEAGSILDVGCGAGEFLLGLDETKWDLYGIDMSYQAIDICHKKGIKNAIKGSLKSITKFGFFDCISFFGSLCRLDNHLEVLKYAYKLLKNHGYIVIADINHASWFSDIAGQEVSKLVPPLHPILLTLDSVLKALENTGFEVMEAQTPGRFDTVEIYRQVNAGRMQHVPQAVYELLEMEYQQNSMGIQDLLVANKASEHMWIAARCV